MFGQFFGHISVEPVAFLAILALYIEFPSIQDLIYTKICLQIVANHPNFTLDLATKPPATKSNPISSITIDLTAANSTLPISDNNNQTIINTVPSSIPTAQSRDHFLCDRLNRSAVPADIRQEITDEDSLFWLKSQLIICLLCALSCPYWGGMSDKIGRLIPLNVPIATGALNNLLSLIFGLLISMDSHTLFKLEWLYAGAILIGISGGQAVVIISSFSFISDNTSDESRSKRIAVLEAVIFLSHSVGFFISKHIMKLGLASPDHPWLNRHVVAFSTCTILNILAIIYSISKLRHQRFHRFLNNFEREHREAFAGAINSSTCSIATDQRATGSGIATGADASHQRRDETGFVGAERLRELTASTPDDIDGPVAKLDKQWTGWSSYLTLKYYAQTYRTLTKRRESRAIILLLILCGFISAMCLTTLMSLLYIYLRAEPFYWTTSQYSSWNATTSITRGLALVLLTICMKFSKFWNIPDALVASVGFFSKGTGLLMIGLAHDSAIIDWSLIAFVLSEYSMPPIRSLLSKLVIQEEVGKIYSCLAAAQNICFLLGNIIFYLAYSSTKIHSFFRLSFMVVAGLQLAAVVIMILIFFNLRRRVIVV